MKIKIINLTLLVLAICSSYKICSYEHNSSLESADKLSLQKDEVYIPSLKHLTLFNLIEPLRYCEKSVILKYLPKDLQDEILYYLPDCNNIVGPRWFDKLPVELQTQLIASKLKLRESILTKLPLLTKELSESAHILKEIHINKKGLSLLQELIHSYITAIKTLNELENFKKMNMLSDELAKSIFKNFNISALNNTIHLVINSMSPEEIYKIVSTVHQMYLNPDFSDSCFSLILNHHELNNIKIEILETLTRRLNESKINEGKKIEFNKALFSEICCHIKIIPANISLLITQCSELLQNITNNYNLIDSKDPNEASWLNREIKKLKNAIAIHQDEATLYENNYKEAWKIRFDALIMANDILESLQSKLPKN